MAYRDANLASDSDEKSSVGSGEPKANQLSMDLEYSRKRDSIEQACARGDFDALVRLATSTGGLLTDDLRRQAWPILLGCRSEHDGAGLKESTQSWRSLPRHPDEDQVRLDVDRAFIYYPKDESEQSLDKKKTELSDLIVATLRSHPVLSYFQSYHDVVQVLLLVLGRDHAAAAVPRISLLRLRDYMLPTISPAQKHFELVSAVVEAADPELADHISKAENSFALSATHSLFAHDIQEYGDIARLYDFLFAHEPVISIYLFSAIMMSRRAELLEMPADQSDILTFMISKLPPALDIDALVLDALQLFRNHPPERLHGFIWWRLSPYSVLKTSRCIKNPQALGDAELLCQKQIRQIQSEELMRRRAKLLFKYRRSALAMTATILVGGLSIWLRRNGQDKVVWFMTSSAFRIFSRQQ
ncbi:uncharacterized protein Z518_04285 [Rhinocladiella mackenziei CBS 650.93]|uniref:Rab-GAP TBC domain-containing protein n=1 Tax=Rhinocladiella mackenziei CBS 650.93 TaxID=1442369 RepID=A0A0D2JB21_9EURO|nr:uncharacterized protein Z518_04285 [Rhinocladiella mackenziei CBS 650.93]KIX06310.1 hypothetical protein Z518_04285 [Rhinocladiella mackenziei CBS 650.93]